MVASVENRLGIGLYTPAEAARYVRARPESLSRWIHGNKHGAPAVRAELEGDEHRTVTFADLIQALAIRAVRTQANKVPLQRIREAVKAAESEHGVTYPLARRHTLYAFDRRIFLKLEGASPRYVGLNKGDDLSQVLLNQIVEPFLEQLSYDSDGLAHLWRPRRSERFEVLLDPSRRFGQPMIVSIDDNDDPGVLADALADAVVSEGSVDAAAEAYERAREAVVLALEYKDALTGIAA